MEHLLHSMKTGQRLSSLLLLAAVVATNAFAGASWTKVATRHFWLYTAAPNRQATQVLRSLEAARSFFVQTDVASTLPAAPVEIVAFTSAREFAQYHAHRGSFAYYQRIRNHDYIAIQQIGSDENDRVAIHEYVHCVLNHAGLKLPLWLDEGLAEVYSSVKPEGGRLRFGVELPQHLRTLRATPALNVQSLFSADRNSSDYTQPGKMNSFYARSWALSHMLLFGSKYAARFREFQAGFAQGQSAVDLLRAVYGEDVATLEHDLKDYLEQGQLRSFSCNCGLDSSDAFSESSAAVSDGSIDVLLSSLVTPNSPDDIELGARLLELSHKPEPGPAVFEALGYRSIRQNRISDARSYFASAFNCGLIDAETVRLYAQLERGFGSLPEHVVPVLLRVVELQPSNNEARLTLGWTAAMAGNYNLAISTLTELRDPPPGQEFTLLYTLAYACLKSDDDERGRKFGLEAQQHAATAQQQRQVEELLRYADWHKLNRPHSG